MPGKSKDTAAAKAGDAPAAAVDKKAADEGDPQQMQAPSVAGYPEVEIAKRSQDVDEPAASEHVKVFVVQKNPLGEDYDDDVHAANIDAMRQSMILQGLRPTEDGRFVGAEDHPDGASVCLTYACACVPAAIATPEQNVVAATVEQQHALEEQMNG